MGSVNTVWDVTEGRTGETEGEGDGDDGPITEILAIGRCFDCRREADTARSCTTTTITFPDGTVQEAIRYGATSNEALPDQCQGCGVSRGGYHHPFCPIEACPRCGGRLVACSCLDADKTR